MTLIVPTNECRYIGTGDNVRVRISTLQFEGTILSIKDNGDYLVDLGVLGHLIFSKNDEVSLIDR